MVQLKKRRKPLKLERAQGEMMNLNQKILKIVKSWTIKALSWILKKLGSK